MKIVVNTCYGGFSLSHEGCLRYLELAGKKVWLEENEKYKSIGPTYWLVPKEERVEDLSSKEWHKLSLEQRIAHNEAQKGQTFYCRDLMRDDPILVRVVEEMGEKANGSCASLDIREIPDGIEWQIEEYDGREWIAEKHRTW